MLLAHILVIFILVHSGFAVCADGQGENMRLVRHCGDVQRMVDFGRGSDSNARSRTVWEDQENLTSAWGIASRKQLIVGVKYISGWVVNNLLWPGLVHVSGPAFRSRNVLSELHLKMLMMVRSGVCRKAPWISYTIP